MSLQHRCRYCGASSVCQKGRMSFLQLDDVQGCNNLLKPSHPATSRQARRVSGLNLG